ncbi:MAG: T9SS type A sorting domain-containing protein, partial [Chitinophagales bacterium]
NLTQWMPVADTAGFLVAYPNGLTDNLGNQYWNVGWSWLPNTDDVAFVSALIDTLHSRYNIDENRVYATGFSAGGFMSHILAAKLSTRITACASVSGGMAPGVFDTIVPSRPVPIIETHGTADGLVPYDGNTGQFASVNTDSLIHFWAVNNLCTLPADSVALPNINTSDGSTVQLFTFTGGSNNASCRLYRIVGADHLDWPGSGSGYNGDFNASVEIWNFFRQYELSDFVGIAPVAFHENHLSIFPQPANDVVNIVLDHSMMNDPSLQLSIFNSLGQVVSQTMVRPSSSLQLNVGHLTKGIYLVVVRSETVTAESKLVKN